MNDLFIDEVANSDLDLTPAEYFEQIKDAKETTTDKSLKTLYENTLSLIKKYKITGQRLFLRKLIFTINNITKEKQLLDLGIDTFVYKSRIEDYIDDVANDCVKIIELENYPREIPNEIVETIEKTKNIFNQFYVVFTDYTGKETKRVEKEKRNADPILFGVFLDEKQKIICDRFYFLGDWIDEYCDLTFDKMVYEYDKEKRERIDLKFKTPVDMDELQTQLDNIKEDNNIYISIDQFLTSDNSKIKKQKKKNIFQKVRSVLKK